MLSKIISHPMNRATPIEEAIGSIIASTPTRIITMGQMIDGRTAASALTVSRVLTAPLFLLVSMGREIPSTSLCHGVVIRKLAIFTEGIALRNVRLATLSPLQNALY